MNVCITTAYPPDRPIEPFREFAAMDRFGVHRLTEDPEAADVILFLENGQYHTDPFYRRLRRHAWLKRYREKVFMYNEHDRAFYVLPGLYCCMPRAHFDGRRMKASDYITHVNPLIGSRAAEVAEPAVLYSFVGARNCRARADILGLTDADAEIRDTSSFNAFDRNVPGRKSALEEYADTLARSRFILCPRGRGTSSYRLFETLEAGRVPVILSDQWVAPEGPDWSTFAVFVPEREVATLPARIRDLDSRWREMGAAARAAWEEWFAPDVKFHRAVERCGELLRQPASARRVGVEPFSRPFMEWAVRTAAHSAVRRASALGPRR